MSVDYRLLPRFEASRKRYAEVRDALPERWRSDPRSEVQVVNDLWVEVTARARDHIDRISVGSRQPSFQDDR